MALYEPGKSVLLHEENGYRVFGSTMCLTVDREGTLRQTAGHKIEEIPPDLIKKLVQRGYNPNDFIYVPYILIKTAARESIEEFEKSLKRYDIESYVRSRFTNKE